MDGAFVLVVAAVCFTAGYSFGGSDGHTQPPSPQQYEQAKADCAPHAGLASAELGLNLIHPDRLRAVCRNGIELSRVAQRPS